MYNSRRRHSDRALRQFYAHILVICEKPESCVNHIHLTAILGGLAKAWAAAEACHAIQNHQQAVDDLHRFAARILGTLQPMCKALGVREASNLLSSLSKLSINPNRMVVGPLDAIAQQLMANMHLANGQDLAEVLAGYSVLQLTPCCENLMQAVSRQLAIADLTHEGSAYVSRVLYSLATIASAAPSIKALDALCERFAVLLRSPQLAELPNAQGIAKSLWALSKLKHAPSDEVVMSMVGRMVALCHLPGQQPMPKAISNVLLACAELSVPVKQADTDSLASFFLSSNRRQGDEQAHTNTAWSLAVIGHLRQPQLMLMLDQMLAWSVSPGQMSTPPVLTAAELNQLYQALDWLQPPPAAAAQQQSAWSSLRGKLHRLGPRPSPAKRHVSSHGKLCSALKQLQLSFRATVSIQSYWVHAVIECQGNKAQSIILTLSSLDYIRNVPGR